MQRTRTDSTANRLRSNSNLTSDSVLDDEEVIHPVEPRARTAMLPPVLVCADAGDKFILTNSSTGKSSG
jgi:hypothetical protein